MTTDLQAASHIKERMPNMATKTILFDPAEHLRSPEDQAELLNDALASGNASYIANALGTIARARGMSEVAREAGVTREALYKAFSGKGDPKLTTLVKVMGALDLKLTALPITRPRRRVARAENGPVSPRLANA